MTVPAVNEAPKHQPASGRIENDRQKRALIVNDEPTRSLLIQEVLIAAGMDAAILASSTESDEYFQKEKYDVVFVNLTMPSANGNELVRKMRKSGFNQKTPIVLISKDQRPVALSQGFEAGATFFVYEPIDRARLVRLVHVTQGTIDQVMRRFRRVQVSVKVRLRCGNTELLGETIDISLNGALVKVPGTVAIGSALELSMDLWEGAAPVVGSGWVTRISTDDQIGILLDHLSAIESARLQEYLLPKIAE
jgi:CheY-like chemotaxis protein